MMVGTTRRRCGSSTTGFPTGFTKLKETAASYRHCAGRVAVAVGRLRQAEAAARCGRAGRGIRDRWTRDSRSPAPSTYAAFSRTCVQIRARLRREPVQVRRHRQRGSSVVPGSKFDSDFAAAIALDRRIARAEAGPVHQPDDRHVSVAVLAALRRLDLARRRGPRVRWRRHRSASSGSPTAMPTLTSASCGRAAVSAQFADAARHHLREAREGPRHRSAGRFRG